MAKVLQATLRQEQKSYVNDQGEKVDYVEYTVGIEGENIVFYPTKESKDLVKFLFRGLGDEVDVSVKQVERTYFSEGVPNDYMAYKVEIDGEEVDFYPNKESKDLVKLLFRRYGVDDKAKK